MKTHRNGPLYREVRNLLSGSERRAKENLDWLVANMPPIFFDSMRGEPGAVTTLCRELEALKDNRHLLLAEREKAMIVARLDVPGSLYETVRHMTEREISYSEMSHSYSPLPGTNFFLEVQRYELDRKEEREIAAYEGPALPEAVRRRVLAAVRREYPEVPPKDQGRILEILWRNNPFFLRFSPPERVARIVWLLHEGKSNEGIFLGLQDAGGSKEWRESRILLAVSNPPERGFLAQIMEVFNRLDLGVRRAYTHAISSGVQPWFLGTFYVRQRGARVLTREKERFLKLRAELSNTLVLSNASPTYKEFVVSRKMTGDEASLINAFIAFSHASLAHGDPDRYDYDEVHRAISSDPEMALRFVRLFEIRFAPEVEGREEAYRLALTEAEREIEEYNTGHRFLDDFRRTVFRATLAMIRRTLKTNAFVAEKHALAFRLDPRYLDDLGEMFTAGLPPERPFRVTFFFTRNALGFHVGFSDIARGGWRTVIARTWDDVVTAANTLFREVYVLAHTQHIKNKDIYEGGSKMVTLLYAPAAPTRVLLDQRLYQVQLAFANAFLDLFVTEDGKARDPRVVDYYGEDEPIELGPDENMHDAMIETIAALAKRRGYILGNGIMSSKRVGINHKEYGVTSTGVVTFAEVAMREAGIDVRKDPFTVKFTGGPNGDVAGNAMRILLSRCPEIRIRLVLDGTGALVDPGGADRKELSRIVLKDDIERFDPFRLSPGGFLLYRNVRKTEGLKELYRRIDRTAEGVKESWLTVDDFYREFEGLIFTVPADLFIPAGGRPETVDSSNCRRFFPKEGDPTVRLIVEGANSFLTPEARLALQEKGVVILRDASANKCGVISSSYEIIANLLLSEKEFFAHKEEYVAGVLEVLEKRASDAAELIFHRYREAGGKVPYTEISGSLSREINDWYARIFDHFQARPDLTLKDPFRRALLAHLPALIRKTPRFRVRVRTLLPKYRAAILAAEIATAIVYRDGFSADFGRDLKAYVSRTFGRRGNDEVGSFPPGRKGLRG
ncbi:MAG: NAD-glutamate dehydrogenase domain-containing protein [Candidatus Deferrimicrobiaceae bacterium]